jgi:hypothetical protein
MHRRVNSATESKLNADKKRADGRTLLSSAAVTGSTGSRPYLAAVSPTRLAAVVATRPVQPGTAPMQTLLGACAFLGGCMCEYS